MIIQIQQLIWGPGVKLESPMRVSQEQSKIYPEQTGAQHVMQDIVQDGVAGDLHTGAVIW